MGFDALNAYAENLSGFELPGGGLARIEPVSQPTGPSPDFLTD